MPRSAVLPPIPDNRPGSRPPPPGTSRGTEPPREAEVNQRKSREPNLAAPRELRPDVPARQHQLLQQISESPPAMPLSRQSLPGRRRSSQGKHVQKPLVKQDATAEGHEERKAPVKWSGLPGYLGPRRARAKSVGRKGPRNPPRDHEGWHAPNSSKGSING